MPIPLLRLSRYHFFSRSVSITFPFGLLIVFLGDQAPFVISVWAYFLPTSTRSSFFCDIFSVFLAASSEIPYFKQCATSTFLNVSFSNISHIISPNQTIWILNRSQIAWHFIIPINSLTEHLLTVDCPCLPFSCVKKIGSKKSCH